MFSLSALVWNSILLWLKTMLKRALRLNQNKKLKQKQWTKRCQNVQQCLVESQGQLLQLNVFLVFFMARYLCQSGLSVPNVSFGSCYGLLCWRLGRLSIQQGLFHCLGCGLHPLSTMPEKQHIIWQLILQGKMNSYIRTNNFLCPDYLALLASSSNCSASRTSSCVCSRMASTFERLRTRSLISSARCLIWRGEAGMDSANTWFATASMLSGSAPSSGRKTWEMGGLT